MLMENNDEGGGLIDSKLAYTLEEEGTYYLRVKAWNHPSAGGPTYWYSLKLMVDTASPPTPTITAPANGAWLDTASQTITATASDAESGVQRVEFWWHNADWGAGQWVWLGADSNGVDGYSWTYTTSDAPEQKGAAFFVCTCNDWGGNATGIGSWNLGIDRTPPVTSMTISPCMATCRFWTSSSLGRPRTTYRRQLVMTFSSRMKRRRGGRIS